MKFTPTHIVVLLVLVLLVFGSSKLPDIARSVGPVSYTHLTLPTNREV